MISCISYQETFLMLKSHRKNIDSKADKKINYLFSRWLFMRSDLFDFVCEASYFKGLFNNYITPKFSIFEHPLPLATHRNKSSTTHLPCYVIFRILLKYYITRVVLAFNITPYRCFRYLFMFHSTHYLHVTINWSY